MQFKLPGTVALATGGVIFWLTVAGRLKKDFAGLKAGDNVKLQLTPYDLSVGRIIISDSLNGDDG